MVEKEHGFELRIQHFHDHISISLDLGLLVTDKEINIAKLTVQEAVTVQTTRCFVIKYESLRCFS